MQEKNLIILVDQIRDGNADSFKVLFDHFSKGLLNFAFSYSKDKQTAEDFVQDAFVALWENRSHLNSELSIKSYLYKAVLNKYYKHVRHLNIVRNSEEHLKKPEASTTTPFDDLHEKEIASRVESVIALLPKGSRLVFEMHRYGGFSYAEIADLQGISINTVKTQMGRALQHLRKHLSPYFFLFI